MFITVNCTNTVFLTVPFPAGKYLKLRGGEGNHRINVSVHLEQAGCYDSLPGPCVQLLVQGGALLGQERRTSSSFFQCCAGGGRGVAQTFFPLQKHIVSFSPGSEAKERCFFFFSTNITQEIRFILAGPPFSSQGCPSAMLCQPDKAPHLHEALTESTQNNTSMMK